ncbi:MAG: outer membrane lipoprotein-sorting protein [Pseudomonadales bacterium]|nr:outer membrane lipoprotein-sorting protein [Pseudomonadales bacterium]
MKNALLKPFLLSCLLAALPVQANVCPTDKAGAIALAIEHASSGWGEIETQMQMIVRSKNGKENTMSLRSQSLEVDGELNKNKITFILPKSVKGTTLLSHSSAEAGDKQWMYTPKTKRVKRILGKNRSRAFAGSQYNFEDLSSYKADKYFNRFLRTEACGQTQCSVLVSYPEYKGSAYSKMISWVDDQSRVTKIDYYDHGGELLKTLTVSEFKKIDDRYWWPMSSHMLNQQNGKSTDLIIKDVKRDVGLKESDFNENALKRS